MTREETWVVPDAMEGVPALIADLLCGSALRLLEGCSLRVKDLDLVRRRVIVRQGKGDKDRIAVLSERLVKSFGEQLASVRSQHERDLAVGAGCAALRGALGR